MTTHAIDAILAVALLFAAAGALAFLMDKVPAVGQFIDALLGDEVTR